MRSQFAGNGALGQRRGLQSAAKLCTSQLHLPDRHRHFYKFPIKYPAAAHAEHYNSIAKSISNFQSLQK
jgi:hypothetical protein